MKRALLEMDKREYEIAEERYWQEGMPTHNLENSSK
jgi:hypothetical protein